MIKGEGGASPTAEELANMFSKGPAPAKSGGGTAAGPNFAAALGASGGASTGLRVADSRMSGGANIRELERTGGASGFGVQNPNGALNTEPVDAVLQRLNNMAESERIALQQKLFMAGYYGASKKPEDIRFGVADADTTKAFAALLNDAANSGDRTWAELLEQQVAVRSAMSQAEQSAAAAQAEEIAKAQRAAALLSAENAYRAANSPEARARIQKTLDELGGSAPSLVENYDPQRTIPSLNPDQARSALTSAFKEAVGRAPSEGELRRFVSNYDAAARRNPIVTQSARNAAGVVTTSQSGGVDSEPIARSMYQNNPEYANYQAVAMYFPAIERVLAGKDLTTI